MAFADEIIQFLFMKQKLAASRRIILFGNIGRLISRNLGVEQIGLAFVHDNISPIQTDMACLYRFDFMSKKRQTCLERRQDFIIKKNFFIYCYQMHNFILSYFIPFLNIKFKSKIVLI